MQIRKFTFEDPDGIRISVLRWLPDDTLAMRGLVQISHGMVETASRYERFAKSLTEAGYGVYANDHRGHGETAGSPEELGMIGADGFSRMVDNMRQLTQIMTCEHPSIPVFLFGHSMGSALTQLYMSQYGDDLAGVILSGPINHPGLPLKLGIGIAAYEMRRYGFGHRSQTMTKLVLGPYNRRIRPRRTEFDWLSRDPEEVAAYIHNPYCGEVMTSGFYYHLLKGIDRAWKKEVLTRIPTDLPVYLIAGEEDPVGAYGRGVVRLANIYRKRMSDVHITLYPGCRHEILNELNRSEVTADILCWLNQQLHRQTRSHR